MIRKAEVYTGEKPYIFISYSHADRDVVMKILLNLQLERYRFWYDEGIDLMKDYTETIVDRINNCEIFMIFLTKASMESVYVQQEIYRAYVAGKKILGVILEQTSLPPGFQLILGVTQYVDKTLFNIEKDFYDKLYKSKAIEKTRENWEEKNFFVYDVEQEKRKRKLASLRYSVRLKCIPCFNVYYQLDVPMCQNRLGGHVAYSIGFDQDVPDKGEGELFYLRNSTPINGGILKYGFPNVTKEELRVDSDEEAEFATQLAVWTTAIGNKELEIEHRAMDMNNLKPNKNYYYYIDRVIAAARMIVKKAVDKPVYHMPVLYINPSDAKLVVNDDYMLAGPYKIGANGFDVSAIHIALDNYEVCVTDKNGIIKHDIRNGDEIYFLINKYEKFHETKVYVYAIGTKIEPRIYGTSDGDDGKTNYLVGVYFPVILEDSTIIKWKKMTGTVKIKSIDQYNTPVQGCIFEIKNSRGHCIASAVSDEKGNVEFKNIETGMLQLFSKQFSDNYIVAKESYNFELQHQSIKEIIYQLRRKPSSRIEITKIDQYKNVLAGAKFELVENCNGKIKYGTTDEHGVLVFEGLNEGSYSLKEIEAPKGYMKKPDSVEINVPYNKILTLKFPNKKI